MPVPSSPQQYKFLHFSFILLICSIVIGITQELITISQPLQPPPSLPSTPYPTSSACHSTKDCNPSHLIGKKIKKREKSPHFFYLVAGGDIMLSRNIGYYNKQSGYDRILGSGTYHPISAFPECDVENCLLFFNLESPFSTNDNDIQLGGFTFRANMKNIQVLQQLRTPSQNEEQEKSPLSPPAVLTGQAFRKGGIPLLLSLANNHLINGGYQGIRTTQDLLRENNIAHIGAGTTPEEARDIFVLHLRKNLTLCAQAYSYEGKTNIKVGGGKLSRNPLDEATILADIEKMKKLNCDVKILSLHRGAEYKIHPNQRQRNLAHTLIDNGADVILGGHSHIPGEIESYRGKYIFYSLGNFIFDQGRGKKARGAGFDYIFDYHLQRQTVPTYLAMLAGLKIMKLPTGVKILLDDIAMTSTTDGIHAPLDEETFSGMVSIIKQ